jgi:hypothetical protein
MESDLPEQETWLSMSDHPRAILPSIRAPQFHLTIISVSPT